MENVLRESIAIFGRTMYNDVGAARSGGYVPSPLKGGEKMDLNFALYIVTFLVVATGYILSIRGNKK
jgi:hypothetical protein